MQIESFIQKRKIVLVGLFLFLVFFTAVVVWYLPVMFKGYSPHTLTINGLLARNVYLTGSYSTENDLNVFLSSSQINQEGHPAVYGNKLTSMIYSRLFGLLGFVPTLSEWALISVIIHAVSLLIFTGAILCLFNLRIAFVFALVYMFVPSNWGTIYNLATYEFAILFFALFVLLYFHGLRQKYHGVSMVVAGIFLTLACLSREAFFLIMPFLCLFLWFKRERRNLVYILIPFVILTGCFWLPGLANNAYTQMFFSQVPEKSKAADFAFYGHVYPDPYTYHFEREEFLESLQNEINNNELSLMEEIDRIRELKNMGIRDISIFNRIRAGLMFSSRHLFRFASLEDIGGPLIFLVFILGAYALHRRREYMFRFCVSWILSSIFLLSFVALAGRNHLMDFGWAIALFVSLGALLLIEIMTDYFKLNNKAIWFLSGLILMSIIYNLILANHVVWSDVYKDTDNLKINAYCRAIGESNVKDSDVIALGIASFHMYELNYSTDKSFVSFRAETIDKLLKKDKLESVFSDFGVKYIIGYSPEQTRAIIEATKVTNIASSDLGADDLHVSRNKGWLLNLVK